MPTCSHCGAYCKDDAAFCSNCGARFVAPKATAEHSEQAFNDYFSRLNDADRVEEVSVDQDTAKKVYDKSPYANAKSWSSDAQPKKVYTTYTANSAGAAAAAQIPVVKVPYRESLAKGWADLRAMPNWIAKMLLLALVSCVPIVNFFAEGFILKWGARAAFGDSRSDMKIFLEGGFVLGFFAFVINLIWGIAFGIVSLIPLAGIVAIVLAAPFMQLCLMRLALSRQFGDAFTFGQMWPVFKENFGSLMALYWLPSLILVGASLVISLIATFAATFMMAAAASESILVIFGMFLVLIMIVLVFIVAIVAVGVELVIARAFGYWIAEAAPAWVDDARNHGYDKLD